MSESGSIVTWVTLLVFTVAVGIVFAAVPDWRLYIVLGAAVVAFFFVVWKVPRWQVASVGATGERRLELENGARQNLVQLIGGAVLLVGLFFTLGQLIDTNRTAQVNEQTFITNRYAQALDSLAKSDRDTCLAGIYTLERIARDSSEDNQPILIILTSFIREHTVGTNTCPGDPKHVCPDIQAVLSVLSRLKTTTEDQAVDLQLDGVRIAHSDLSATHLSGTDSSGAHLRNVNFTGADLRGATFIGADLRGDRFNFSHLDGATFRTARFKDTHFSQAFLANVRLEGVKAPGLDLANAHLAGAGLSEAVLPGTCLLGADLNGAYLGHVDLQGASLNGADLSNAHLTDGADLRDSNFAGAQLARADFRNDDLRKAIRLTRKQIAAAMTGGARLPPHIPKSLPPSLVNEPPPC